MLSLKHQRSVITIGKVFIILQDLWIGLTCDALKILSTTSLLKPVHTLLLWAQTGMNARLHSHLPLYLLSMVGKVTTLVITTPLSQNLSSFLDTVMHVVQNLGKDVIIFNSLQLSGASFDDHRPDQRMSRPIQLENITVLHSLKVQIKLQISRIWIPKLLVVVDNEPDDVVNAEILKVTLRLEPVDSHLVRIPHWLDARILKLLRQRHF